jgi:acyl carrier protein
MPTAPDGRAAIINCLRQFLQSTGRGSVVLSDRTHLTRDLGLSSDEGVDFVLDLCDALGVDLPGDFNPFVEESGRRGRRVGQMVKAVLSFVPAREIAQ